MRLRNALLVVLAFAGLVLAGATTTAWPPAHSSLKAFYASTGPISSQAIGVAACMVPYNITLAQYCADATSNLDKTSLPMTGMGVSQIECYWSLLPNGIDASDEVEIGVRWRTIGESNVDSSDVLAFDMNSVVLYQLYSADFNTRAPNATAVPSITILRTVDTNNDMVDSGRLICTARFVW